jgi:NAD(P)-dependent dehydrogenase (short-subunit alcohol dehydrogenase family)
LLCQVGVRIPGWRGARYVTDDASVTAAVETVGALDVLVNNAGISGGRIGPGDATVDDLRKGYDTNVFGPVRVLHPWSEAYYPVYASSKPHSTC